MCPAVFGKYQYERRTVPLYIMKQKKGGGTHVWKAGRRRLFVGDLRGSSWLWNPDRGNFSSGSAAVPGSLFVDCMRLCLLQALIRRFVSERRYHEYRGLEVPEGAAWYSAKIIPGEGITNLGGS